MMSGLSFLLPFAYKVPFIIIFHKTLKTLAILHFDIVTPRLQIFDTFPCGFYWLSPTDCGIAILEELHEAFETL